MKSLHELLEGFGFKGYRGSGKLQRSTSQKRTRKPGTTKRKSVPSIDAKKKKRRKMAKASRRINRRR